VNSLQPASKPWWQQATALVSLSAGGAITGFSFMPKAAVDFSCPTSLPVNLLALQHSVRQAPASDATLRTAIVNVAQHYLQLAQDKTPAEMEAMIWQQDSADHADHGPSCAAFASLTLELAAKVVGQQSWVTGGSSYPWPLHTWADVRVDENPASPGIISIQQDAQTHGRWHPLGDGYQPQPGDWVLFQGHVEVVTDYAHGVLHTIGGDSLPNFSVNAHQYPGPLSGDGVVGFVNNGSLSSAVPAGTAGAPGTPRAGHGRSHAADTPGDAAAAPGQAAIPGAAAATPDNQATPGNQATPAKSSGVAAGLADIPGSAPAGRPAKARHRAQPAVQGHGQAQADVASGQAAIPGAAGPTADKHGHRHGAGKAGSRATDVAADSGGAAIPGVVPPGQNDPASSPGTSSSAGHQQPPASTAPAGETATQQAFINAVAPGAIASQRAYGVPAAVTIAQAIEESDWGQSLLASQDYNLFGMKGTGPAGSEALPTQEYENGQWITTTAPFRVYHNFAESIDDHGRLLADSGYYQQAMAVRRAPNAFASALTGVYATDPGYGAKLISLMRQYNLYQYDAGTPAAASTAKPRPRPSPTARHRPAPSPTQSTTPTTAPSGPTPTPTATRTHTPAAGPTPTRTPTATPSPAHSPSTAPTPAHTPAATATASPSGTSSHPPAAIPGSGHPHAPAISQAGPPGQAAIPGVPDAAAPAGHAATRGGADVTPQPSATATTRADRRAAPRRAAAHPVTQSAVLTAQQTPLRAGPGPRPASSNRRAWTTLRRYRPEIPPSVHTAFLASAKVPLRREEPLYREVAVHADIPWKVLAAADWMQCEARSGYSPVHGEKLGAINLDGTSYTTRSAALEQCADDLRDLAWSVYQVDLTERRPLSVGDLASVFAAFRWGQLLAVHRTSALEFPYSVAGLTTAHLHMRWPKIDEPDAPDKPGARFRRPFGAVPIVLGLGYPAVV
jgi:flagellum-specific peptidoglycan hydrolase FlgJ